MISTTVDLSDCYYDWLILERVISSALGIWALSCIPTAAADLWDECVTNAWVSNHILRTSICWRFIAVITESLFREVSVILMPCFSHHCCRDAVWFFTGLVWRLAQARYPALPRSISLLLVVGVRPSQLTILTFFLYIVVVLLVLLCLVICVIYNRRARAFSEQEYNVEANQVDGPPTIIATEYDPTSGPSGIYEGPKSSFSAGQTSAQMTGPTYPVAAQVYNQNRTAPVTQTSFPYPFPGNSPVSRSLSFFFFGK